ncbi:CaiB/BaiF CoA-transferase family protein [Halococcus sp. IIIV-5B]|uniref:CaiB/BaiF CoA transferase family protein n=1 Tax=Halococcus sp. IIIV-5B TaxID=2321230 RepID=UPI000E735CFB|nr:CaiB/BaiF CoA-transferase family protein [Halococcus sp. IIIV-5B]RJT06755.1 CoA transferase [Halococcus sp. IIIV-5B]
MTGEAREADGETGPLDGLTVLDASRVLAGPFCTMQLGDLGAEVIKVERPDGGDQTRGWQPPSYGESDESAYYMSINRNKRSIALNLASADGREVFRALAREADVLVENFRVGKMDDWGLGYDDLAEVNPELVYCSLSGYGEWGPDADRPAYDIIMQAEGGLMSITGEEGRTPVRVGVALADIGAGMYATQAILAALLERELGNSGGQKVDISLFDGQVAWMTYMASNYFATGDPPTRMGSRHPTIVPYQAFETQDSYVVVAVGSEAIWARFCTALDRNDLAEDERFSTNADRVANREELDSLLADEIGEYGTDEVLSLFDDHDVPASDVHDMADIFETPQVEARGMHREIEHPTAGSVEMPGSPMHFSNTPTTIRQYPPRLGEHTRELLHEAGYEDEAIEDLVEADVVAPLDE